MKEKRGIQFRFIADGSGVIFPNMSAWLKGRRSIGLSNLIKLENFIKGYYLVNSLKDVEEIFDAYTNVIYDNLEVNKQ